jgi:type I restriction enzyme S subunit
MPRKREDRIRGFFRRGSGRLGSTDYIVLQCKQPLPLEFGYFLARSEEFRAHAILNMTGTTGRQRVPVECFDKYKVVVPSKPVADRFGEYAKSVMRSMKSNDEQSETLTALRDSLLPKLLSGEVTVKDYL